MLAYVFWHRPRAEVAGPDYEKALLAYHAELGEEAIEGFHGSATHSVDDLPWLGGGPAYEDWYLLEAAWALDTLGAAATSGRLEEPHRQVAARTGSMAAGLYGLVRGEVAGGAHAGWFPKPGGESYDSFYARLEPLIGGSSSLWRRQFVLGPTPEFCLLSDRPPAIASATRVARRRLSPPR
jgi:hypothetical protein